MRQKPRCTRRAAVLAWLLFALAVAASPGAQSTASTAFPKVSAYNLEKAHITLPDDLRGDRNLLVLYFKLDQEPDVKAWNTIADQWHGQNPSLVAYDCLVSPRSNFISRWWQNSSLRSDLQDTRRWSTTIPLYVDKMQFLHALRITGEKQVAVLLVDRSGHVLKKVAGPPTEQNLMEIRSVLAGP